MSLGLWLGEPACSLGGFCRTEGVSGARLQGPGAAPVLFQPQRPSREFTALQEGPGFCGFSQRRITCGTEFEKQKQITVPPVKGSHRLCVCVSVCPGLGSSVGGVRELVQRAVRACGHHTILSLGHVAEAGRAASIHPVHRCGLVHAARAVQPAAVCLSVSVAPARPLLTPLSHRYIGPSTVFGSGGKLANVEQWRCVSILRSHSGGEWAARGGAAAARGARGPGAALRLAAPTPARSGGVSVPTPALMGCVFISLM